jgi:hypothetical protein
MDRRGVPRAGGPIGLGPIGTRTGIPPGAKGRRGDAGPELAVWEKEKALRHNIATFMDLDGFCVRVRSDGHKQVPCAPSVGGVKFPPERGSVTLSGPMSLARAGQWSRDGGPPVAPSMAPVLPADGQKAHVLLCVSDTGIGIRPEDLERIFQPPEQGDGGATRGYQGTALGLCLTRRLVELHGGMVRAGSDQPGRGSRFPMALPSFPGNSSRTAPAQGLTADGRATLWEAAP